MAFLRSFFCAFFGGVRVAPDREIAGQGALVGEARARLARRGRHRIGRSLPLPRLVDEQERVDARRREPRGGGEQRRDFFRRPGDSRPEQAHVEIGVLAAEEGGEPQRPIGKSSERQQRGDRAGFVARDDDHRRDAPGRADGLQPQAGEVEILIGARRRGSCDFGPGLARRLDRSKISTKAKARVGPAAARGAGAARRGEKRASEAAGGKGEFPGREARPL